MNETLRCADTNSERTSIPANPKHYWHYRMHLTLEALLDRDGYNRRLRPLMHPHGR